MKKLLMLGLVCALSAGAMAQWLEKTVWLPNSMPYIYGSTIVMFNPDNEQAYVAGYESEYLQILNYTTRQKVKRIEQTYLINTIFRCPDRNRLYLVSEDIGGLYVLDERDSLLGEIEFDSNPLSGLYNPQVQRAYFGCEGGFVQVFDPGPDTALTRVSAGDDVVALRLDSAANRVFALSRSGRPERAISVIDCAADTLAAWLPAPDGERLGIEWNPVTRRLYCLGNSRTRSRPEVWVYDADSLSVIATVALPESWHDMEGGLLLNPGSEFLYAYWAFLFRGASWPQDSIAVINCADNTIHGYVVLPEDNEVSGLSLNRTDSKVYVAFWETDSVAVLGQPDSITGWIRTGVPGWCAAWNPDRNEVFIPGDDDILYIASGATDSIVATVEYRPFPPEGICWVPAGNKLYVLSDDGIALIGSDNEIARITWRRLYDPEVAPAHVPELNRLYFYGRNPDSQLIVYDCNTDSILAEKWLPRWVSLSPFRVPGLHKLYLAAYDRNVVVYDVYQDSALKVIPDCGTHFCYNPRSGMVYAGDVTRPGISVVHPGPDSVITTIVGYRASSMAANPTDNELYVASSRDLEKWVRVLDCASNTIADSVYVGAPTLALAWYEPANKLYAVTDTLIHVIDCRSRQVAKTIRAGWFGEAKTLFAARNDKLWVGRLHSVSVVQCRIDSLTANFSDGTASTNMAWNPIDNRVYTANRYSNYIDIYRDDPSEIGEPPAAGPRVPYLGPTIVRGVLRLRDCHPIFVGEIGGCTQPTLLDISGRKVMGLLPGDNDIRHLSPGVYFVRGLPGSNGELAPVGRLIVTR